MKTVKLFSQTPRTAGTTTTLPLVGRVTFDEKENFIEVDKDHVDELKKLDFGVVLLTAEEVSDKKRQLEDVKKKLVESKAPIPLVEAFEKLKENRSDEEKSYLNDLISDLKSQEDPEVQSKISENVKMLEALDEKEVKTLLEPYPAQEKKKLKTTKDIIGFLAKKMISK